MLEVRMGEVNRQSTEDMGGSVNYTVWYYNGGYMSYICVNP